MLKKALMIVGLCGLTACETPTTARYSISADNNIALKKLNATGITVGAIAEPREYDVNCRMLGALKAPDEMTHAQYIRKALEDELKVAGAYAEAAPTVTLSGAVEHLDVGSMNGLTNGAWEIQLRLDSSNGKSLTVNERYQFKSGFSAASACPNVAQAFLPAVQNLIKSAITSPQFPTLLIP